MRIYDERNQVANVPAQKHAAHAEESQKSGSAEAPRVAQEHAPFDDLMSLYFNGSAPVNANQTSVQPAGPAVQMREGSPALAPRDVHRVAQQGTSGAGSQLPHLDTIQRAFGKYDVSNVNAYSDTTAQEANRALGSQAFAAGNHVALGSTHDLFSVAHEAAHVVQQRGGVSVDVGQKGDSYEQHADHVAKMVVEGHSAEPLLDTTAGSVATTSHGPSTPVGAVQFLHGDMATPVLPKFGGDGTKTVGSEVDAKFNRDSRDKNMNPKRKVEFEAKLAAAILQDRESYKPTVLKVSRGILAYLETRAGGAIDTSRSRVQGEVSALLAHLGEHLAGNTKMFGRLADRVEDLRDGVAGKLRRVLQGSGTIPQHMFAQHQFMDQFYQKDWENGIAQQIQRVAKERLEPVKAKASAPKYLKEGTEAIATGNIDSASPKGLREGAQAPVINPDGTRDDAQTVNDPFDQVGKATGGSTGAGGRDKRGRFGFWEEQSRGSEEFGTPQGTPNPLAETPSGITHHSEPVDTGLKKADYAGSDGLVSGKHSRGADLWTIDEEQEFMQQARLVLDMPVAAGFSGTTTDLMAVAQAFGVSGPELYNYTLACLGHLGSASAHSFHEIMSAAATAGVSYVPGNYNSIIPPSKRGSGAISALFDEYADVLNPNNLPDTVPPAGGGTAPTTTTT